MHGSTTRIGGRTGRIGLVAALLAGALATTAGCAGGDRSAVADPGGSVPTLTWWAMPNFEEPAAKVVAACNAKADGAWRIRTRYLPQQPEVQRERLVRQLAARDQSVNLVQLDMVWAPEFARAGWILPFTGTDAAAVREGVLSGPLKSVTWRGQTWAAPMISGAQLMWYRRSRLAAVGLDPARQDVSWDQLIDGLSRLPEGQRGIGVQTARYEGYTVFVGALLAGAGGAVVNDAGAPVIDSPAGAQAARVIAKLAHSPAADPALPTMDEETGKALVFNGKASAMVNWGYVYSDALKRAEADPAFRPVLADLAWARYPRTVAGRPSAPPLGGSNIAVGAYTPPALRKAAFAAAACLTSTEAQRTLMVEASMPAARSAVYDDPAVRKVQPFADLLRQSVNDGVPRPQIPAYTAVSDALQRAFTPPAGVDPALSPARAGEFIRNRSRI